MFQRFPSPFATLTFSLNHNPLTSAVKAGAKTRQFCGKAFLKTLNSPDRSPSPWVLCPKISHFDAIFTALYLYFNRLKKRMLKF